MQTENTGTIGPILILDDVRAQEMHLSALFIAGRGAAPPVIEMSRGKAWPEPIAEFQHAIVWRARFSLPADRSSEYSWNGDTYPVAGGLTGDLRFAYVSCNGEEVGDLHREDSERNLMWGRLRDEHVRQPFTLILHGGDQVYADEVTLGHELSENWPERLPRDPSRAGLAGLRHHLREKFLERYAMLYAAPQFAWLAARVPSLMQWDDHDICDGWGSLRRSSTYSPVGQALFDAAREAFLIFQQGAGDGDLPPRFADPSGRHLGWSIRAGGLRILAPDLRSERTRREIMGAGGWSMMEAEAERAFQGQTLLLSSVPLLGPRLSLLEIAMMVAPRMQKYEDDLRDQWQSRAHRAEWRRMLRLVRDMARRDHHDVTAISGEIHLATRAVMDLGDRLHLHQLVASGIAHRAPSKAWARILGALSFLGEDPLREHPIRIARLPGQPVRYVAERNYLVLERHDNKWFAWWDLEFSGPTPALAI